MGRQSPKLGSRALQAPLPRTPPPETNLGSPPFRTGLFGTPFERAFRAPGRHQGHGLAAGAPAILYGVETMGVANTMLHDARAAVARAAAPSAAGKNPDIVCTCWMAPRALWTPPSMPVPFLPSIGHWPGGKGGLTTNFSTTFFKMRTAG